MAGASDAMYRSVLKTGQKSNPNCACAKLCGRVAAPMECLGQRLVY